LQENEIKEVKVFISYSWSNKKIIDWVRDDLATRLLDDSVEVILDQWDLKDGHDVYEFMESVVNDPTIDKVLVICDKGYQEKANDRAGGVGVETRLITPKLYSEGKQEKFIPIVAERDNEGKDYIPHYMSSRKYIDMSTEELYIENYETLLRTLFDRPANRKPKKGKPPAFLFEDEQINDYKFHFLLKQIKMDLEKERYTSATSKMIEFKSDYVGTFQEFEVSKSDHYESTAATVEEKIDNMLILRNDFIELLETSTRYDRLSVDYLVNFFEEMFNEYKKIEWNYQGGHYPFQFDNYPFLIKELFLYTCAVLIKNEKYELLSEFLYSRFFVYKDSPSNGIEGTTWYEAFNIYLKSLDEIQVKTKDVNYFSYASEKISRRIYKGYSMVTLSHIDLLLYYLSTMSSESEYSLWYPHSYTYSKRIKMELLQKMESARHFEKVKMIFDVQNKEDLISKFADFKNPYREGYRFRDGIPDISYHIDYSKICTFR
jgi:hypothetical protein